MGRSLRGPQAAVSGVAVRYGREVAEGAGHSASKAPDLRSKSVTPSIFCRPARSAVSGCGAHPCPAHSRSQSRGAAALGAEVGPAAAAAPCFGPDPVLHHLRQPLPSAPLQSSCLPLPLACLDHLPLQMLSEPLQSTPSQTTPRS